MTDARSSKDQPVPHFSQSAAISTAALAFNAETAQITAEAEQRDRTRSDSPRHPSRPRIRPKARKALAHRRQEPIRRSRVGDRSAQGSDSDNPIALDDAQNAAEDLSRTDTRSELRDWIKDNATLLSNASLLISLAAVALSLLPDVGFFAPYIQALLFAAALLLLTELHHQWPEDLQLHMLRKNARPENHSWRMTGFAFVMQVATLVFAGWAILANPIILLPLTALGVVLAFRQWYFRRYGGLLARSFGLIALVAALLLSELLMLVVWAALTGETVTLELWVEDRPDLQLDR